MQGLPRFAVEEKAKPFLFLALCLDKGTRSLFQETTRDIKHSPSLTLCLSVYLSLSVSLPPSLPPPLSKERKLFNKEAAQDALWFTPFRLKLSPVTLHS